MTPKRILLLVILILFAIFIVQNAQMVEVNIFFWTTEASRALVLLITFCLGLISGWVSAWTFGKKSEEPSQKNEN